MLRCLVVTLTVVAFSVFVVAFSVFVSGELPCGDPPSDFRDLAGEHQQSQQTEAPLTKASADRGTILPVSATGLSTPLFSDVMASRTKSVGGGVAICVRIRNEAPHLSEWLAFHMAVGVSKVIVLDDGSTDNPRAQIRPFEQCGFAEYHVFNISAGAGPGRPNSEPVRKQMQPLNECMARLRSKCSLDIRWLALTDADEFIYPSTPNRTLPDTFTALEKHHCITLPRTQFGSAGHIRRPTGLTIRAFQHRSAGHLFRSNRYPKLVVNIKPVNRSLMLRQLTNMHTPPGKSQRNRGPHPCFGWPTQAIPQLRLNHYLRSVEDFNVKLKYHFPDSEKFSGFFDMFMERDENDIFDGSASRWGVEVDAIIKRVTAKFASSATGTAGCALEPWSTSLVTRRKCY